MRRLALLALIVAGPVQAGETRLTDASVRTFVARQEAAWNAKDAKAFTATFSPDAVFADQAVGSDGKLLPNGKSTLAEASAQARRFFAKAPFHATAAIQRVTLSPDGRSAQVLGLETTRIEAPGKPPRSFCARTEQTLVLAAGRILSRGQTDTDIRCPK